MLVFSQKKREEKSDLKKSGAIIVSTKKPGRLPRSLQVPYSSLSRSNQICSRKLKIIEAKHLIKKYTTE